MSALSIRNMNFTLQAMQHIRDQKDAFFTLDQKGELQPLHYDTDIAENHILWD